MQCDAVGELEHRPRRSRRGRSVCHSPVHQPENRPAAADAGRLHRHRHLQLVIQVAHGSAAREHLGWGRGRVGVHESAAARATPLASLLARGCERVGTQRLSGNQSVGSSEVGCGSQRQRSGNQQLGSNLCPISVNQQALSSTLVGHGGWGREWRSVRKWRSGNQQVGSSEQPQARNTHLSVAVSHCPAAATARRVSWHEPFTHSSR